jgi:alpha-tubulin suppressor-like RCC1 family protein
MGTNLIPVPLATSDTPAHIAGGYFHTCIAYENSDLVYCWGSNSAGQLGIEDTNNRGDDPNEMGANLPPVKLW